MEYIFNTNDTWIYIICAIVMVVLLFMLGYSLYSEAWIWRDYSGARFREQERFIKYFKAGKYEKAYRYGFKRYVNLTESHKQGKIPHEQIIRMCLKSRRAVLSEKVSSRTMTQIKDYDLSIGNICADYCIRDMSREFKYHKTHQVEEDMYSLLKEEGISDENIMEKLDEYTAKLREEEKQEEICNTN